MPVEEIIKLLEKHPRICLKDMERMLNHSNDRIRCLISKLIRINDIKPSRPTKEEKQYLLKKYPTLVRSWNLVVYELA